jgi:proteasome assembly chaperone (PAC2) family protein
MAEQPQLTHPWLVAVWPGMGHVALNAGYYLLAKLDMKLFAEVEASDLFDIDHVEVKDGLVQPARRPRNRWFVWSDPQKRHDLVVFLGEAQPPLGKYAFCRQLISFARGLGVERVFTFAAMATQMHPEHPSRVFAAATDKDRLEELKRLELELLEDGHIGGLNGVLLGAAVSSERGSTQAASPQGGGLPGACLLGEMPHIFSHLPFPKASLAILEVFTALTGIELDFTELAEQARIVEEQLGEMLAQVEKRYGEQHLAEEEYSPEPTEGERLRPADRQRIEDLFRQAAADRSKAFELKQELDRLGLFKEYEDRFLDLFKKPGQR